MKALIEPLTRFVPPLWFTLTLALALAAAAALLTAFIDTLHQNVRHGEEMRQWQRVGAAAPALGTVAQRQQVSQLGAAASPSFQR